MLRSFPDWKAVFFLCTPFRRKFYPPQIRGEYREEKFFPPLLPHKFLCSENPSPLRTVLFFLCIPLPILPRAELFLFSQIPSYPKNFPFSQIPFYLKERSFPQIPSYRRIILFFLSLRREERFHSFQAPFRFESAFFPLSPRRRRFSDSPVRFPRIRKTFRTKPFRPKFFHTISVLAYLVYLFFPIFHYFPL